MSTCEIILKRSAVGDMDKLRKHYASQIAEAMVKHLRHEPTKESKSRIKRLRGIRNPDYRLLVGEYRVFYTVDRDAPCVNVLRVMHKDETHSYYKEIES